MTTSDAEKSPVERQARVALICSSWHSDVVEKCRDALLLELSRNDLPASQVDLFDVPGAFEIPLLAKKLAHTGSYAALVACGFVVYGGIHRHDFVAGAVIDGLMRVQLESDIPILSAVLTPRNFHEHDDHQRFFAEHMAKKGTEVARACVQTLNNFNGLNHPGNFGQEATIMRPATAAAVGFVPRSDYMRAKGPRRNSRRAHHLEV